MFERIALCTAILGLFMAVPMMAMARKRPANFWLGMFIYSLASLCFAEYCGRAGIFQLYPNLFGVFDWPVISLGPVYYCYVRSMVGLGNGRRQAWHCLPLGLGVGLLLWARLVANDQQLQAWPYGWIKAHVVAVFLSIQLLTAGYALAVLYRLHQYRRQLQKWYSSTKDRDLAWLTWLTVAIVVLLAMWLTASFGGYWLWALLIGRILLLYFIGWYGLRQVAVFLPQEGSGQAVKLPESAAATLLATLLPESDQIESSAEQALTADIDPAIIESDKYARSGMTDAARQLIGVRLLRRMSNDRDYLDSDLKLIELAERIGTSPQLLSQYINDVLGLNFFDYINGLRIADVQRMMRDESKADRTLLDLAFAAGFNSKSTFNSSFKKITGLPPSNWRNLHARTSEPIS